MALTPFGKSFLKLLTRHEQEQFEDELIRIGGPESLLPVDDPLTHCPLCGRIFRAEGECRVHSGYQEAIEIAELQRDYQSTDIGANCSWKPGQ